MKTKATLLCILLSLFSLSCSENDNDILNTSDELSSSNPVSSSRDISSYSSEMSSSSEISSSNVSSSSSSIYISSYSSSILDTILAVSEVMNKLGIDSLDSVNSSHWIHIWDSLRHLDTATFNWSYEDSSLIPHDSEISINWCTFPSDSLTFKEWDYKGPGIYSITNILVLSGADTLYTTEKTKRHDAGTELVAECFVGDVKMTQLDYCYDSPPNVYIFEYSDGFKLRIIPRNLPSAPHYEILPEYYNPSISCPI